MSTKILIIEDDPLILKHTLEILSLEGFETIGAEDGLVGLTYATLYLPNLIISDITMPGLDGYQLLTEVRKNPLTAAIPFIFLTAQSRRSNVREGMRSGADDYLTKPFTVPELLMAVSARLERQAIVEREQEQKLNELRGEISYSLPHELRTPLQTILGYADFIAENVRSLDEPTMLRVVAGIQGGGRRLEHLIENYLIYAQIEFLKVEVQIKIERENAVTANPSTVITNCAKEKAREMRRDADLVLALTEDRDIPISEESFLKVVDELVDNAFKFSEKNNPVKIETTYTDEGYTLRVTDSGRGMTKEQITSIAAFRQFKRKIYEQQGSGLGLVIAMGLVELYGGTLKIENAPGQDKGVAVTVTLPT